MAVRRSRLHVAQNGADMALMNPTRPRGLPSRQPVDIRGTDAGFSFAFDGNQRAEFIFDDLSDFGFRNERVVAAILGAASTSRALLVIGNSSRRFRQMQNRRVAQRHVFDEANRQPAIQRHPREIDQFIAIGPAHRDAVDLQAVEPDILASIQSGHDLLQISRSRDAAKFFRLQRIEADRYPIETGFAQRIGQFQHSLAVGSEG